MRTLTDVSPYQVSMAMRVSRDVARDMLADDSGSTYTRDVFGTRYTLDPVARTLTETYDADADDADDATPAETGHAFSFYVGSTPTHDAHSDDDAWTLRRIVGEWESPLRVHGIWEGETEGTAIYETRLPDDATAQRIAYALAVLTGNDCVMVTRCVRRGESDRAMSSVRPYLAACEHNVTEGNRVTYGTGDARGYRFVPDARGTEVAYLVWSDASVSAVQ